MAGAARCSRHRCREHGRHSTFSNFEKVGTDNGSKRLSDCGRCLSVKGFNECQKLQKKSVHHENSRRRKGKTRLCWKPTKRLIKPKRRRQNPSSISKKFTRARLSEPLKKNRKRNIQRLNQHLLKVNQHLWRRNRNLWGVNQHLSPRSRKTREGRFVGNQQSGVFELFYVFLNFPTLLGSNKIGFLFSFLVSRVLAKQGFFQVEKTLNV